jgi:hypothetical protein
MFANSIRRATTFAIFFATATACPQTELKPLPEIHLPISSSRGSFNHFPYSEMSAHEHFALRVAPDQSLLVFNSDASCHWPLVRVSKWWTDHPVSEVLDLPGWTSADAKNLDRLNVDVQITPDGRYAVAFAGAYWMDKSVFLIHAPRNYVQRKPDTLITLIDLTQWKIVRTLHTTAITGNPLAGVRIANNQWLVLDFSLGRSPLKPLLNRFDTRLLSLADLQSGPHCLSDRPLRTGIPFLKSDVDRKPTEQHNNIICQDVLLATASPSVQALETFLYRGQDVLPPAVQQASPDLQDTEDEFFGGWGEYPYFLFYAENPPFESASRHWYGLYNNTQQRGFDNLITFDPDGHKQSTHLIDQQQCGDPALDQHGSACGCRVVDASDPTQTLLSRCRTQRGDYAGMVRREWLSVLYTDHFSTAGFIPLSHKDVETLQALALGDGQPYVVTLESGDSLKVYAIPYHLQPDSCP